MKELNLDLKDRRIIYNLYKNQSADITIDNESASAKIRRSVRQGCSLSPLLFNCYIEKSITEIKDKLNRLEIGSKVGGILIPTIRFAEDIVLLAETEHDIQRALAEMQIIINKYQMCIQAKQKFWFVHVNPQLTQIFI
jgi:hypothetical protein